jgi:hypothetical protein
MIFSTALSAEVFRRELARLPSSGPPQLTHTIQEKRELRWRACMPLLELVNTFWDIGMDDEN